MSHERYVVIWTYGAAKAYYSCGEWVDSERWKAAKSIRTWYIDRSAAYREAANLMATNPPGRIYVARVVTYFKG